MTPDPRLAALRALAVGAIADGFDREPQPYVNLAGSVCVPPPDVLSLLDALAAAEGECFKAEHDLGRMMSERDALAARLAGARNEGLAEAIRLIDAEWYDQHSTQRHDGERLCAELRDRLNAKISESGGEGRGT